MRNEFPEVSEFSRRGGILLKQSEYALIKDSVSGALKVLTGPLLYFMGPYETLQGRVTAGRSLGPIDYLKVRDNLNGEIRLEQGPQLWFPGPTDEVLEELKAVVLKHNEFVKIQETATGMIKVVRGPGTVFLTPTESIVDAKKKSGVRPAVCIDSHTAAMVRNTKTGQLRLETTQQLFFPSAVEEIVSIERKVVLEDHQVCIIRDKDGRYIFKKGKVKKDEESKDSSEANDKRSFFLPPYSQLVGVRWFRHDDVEDNEAEITHFDLRPHFMGYGFNCRTTDNVELHIDITLFWQITNIKLMITKTDDLPSDICNHARSVIIQHVSKVPLERFMSQFNKIIYEAVLESDDDFYAGRGAVVHSVEVRSIRCVDKSTEKVLQEIIKETTDRLNRLQKQASENEVKLFKRKGDIEEEKLNGELLKIRKDHVRADKRIQGESEANMIVAFMQGLDKHNIPYQYQLEMWRTLRRTEAIDSIAGSGSSMFFTSDDVDYSLEEIRGKKK